MSARVFISYRRDDAAHVAGRIADALAARVGRANVFVDVDSVAPGEDFVRKIEATIQSSTIFLAVIGSEWLNAATPQGQRRIDLPGDFIRLEVRSALASGVTIIPVLIDGADMPRAEDLPEDIHQLVRHNAVHLSHTTFARDMPALIDQLGLPKRRSPLLTIAALPIGAALVAVALLAASLWPKGPTGPPGLATSVSLAEAPQSDQRWLTDTAYAAERGADGRLYIRAQLPYRDRMRDEKRIDGLAFLNSAPLRAPLPKLTVQVTNSRTTPVSINELQIEVVKAVPDTTPLPVLREHQVDYQQLTLFNEGWGDLQSPHLKVTSWGLPEADKDRSIQAWKGGVQSREPCAHPTGIVSPPPVTADGVITDRGATFDLEGKVPASFGSATFVCALGELTYAHDGLTESLAVRTRISNKRPSTIVAAPLISLYDLYLDPDREGYVTVVPFLREIAPGATETIALRVRTDRTSTFQLHQSVRTAGGEVIPGETFGLEVFVTRHADIRYRLDEARRSPIDPTTVALFDKSGLVLMGSYDPQGVEPAFFELRNDTDAAACAAFLKDVAPQILRKINQPVTRIEVRQPWLPDCHKP